MCIDVDAVSRPIVTKSAMPLHVIHDVLPSRLHCFAGDLIIGACVLDHEDDTSVGHVLDKGFGVSFSPQSMREFDEGCVREDMSDLWCHLQDEFPHLSDEELDAKAELAFKNRFGHTFDETLARIAGKYVA